MVEMERGMSPRATEEISSSSSSLEVSERVMFSLLGCCCFFLVTFFLVDLRLPPFLVVGSFKLPLSVLPTAMMLLLFFFRLKKPIVVIICCCCYYRVACSLLLVHLIDGEDRRELIMFVHILRALLKSSFREPKFQRDDLKGEV